MIQVWVGQPPRLSQRAPRPLKTTTGKPIVCEHEVPLHSFGEAPNGTAEAAVLPNAPFPAKNGLETTVVMAKALHL